MDTRGEGRRGDAGDSERRGLDRRLGLGIYRIRFHIAGVDPEAERESLERGSSGRTDTR